MYTKIFLFILVLNIIPQQASNGISSQKQNINIEHSQNNSEENSGHRHTNNESNKPNPLSMDWTDISQHFMGQHNSEDDGKCHNIHFERYLNRRNKYLYCLFGKLILLISYLCSLLTIYVHLMH
jgi:hypothetical protein